MGNEDAMVQQAKELDTIGAEEQPTKVEDERDHDGSPTRLFSSATCLGYCLEPAQETSRGGKRLGIPQGQAREGTHNVPDADEHSKAMVVQHTSWYMMVMKCPSSDGNGSSFLSRHPNRVTATGC